MEKEMLQERITCYDIGDSERHQYDREFLLAFQFSPICTAKPDGLPPIDNIVLDEAHAGTKALIPGKKISTKNDLFQNGGRNAGGGGGRRNPKHLPNGTGSQNSPARVPKVIQAPQFDNIELKKSENIWVRPSEKVKDMKDEDKSLFELNRSVRGILNKLTPQKFKTLVTQMMELKIDSALKLESAINMIFEKAISEPGFSIAYARMCRLLTDQFNNVPEKAEEPTNVISFSKILKPAEPTNVVTFRQMLLRKVQTEFEKDSRDEKLLEEEREKTFDTEAEKNAWLKELDNRELVNRRRTLGNIKFIGELFKLKMIGENIMHECIHKLLRIVKPDSLEDQLECVCKLLTTIGKGLDNLSKAKMDSYFEQMNVIIGKGIVSSRIKFAMTDVIELRQNGWVPRNDDGNLKTINQIHKEAQEKEKATEMAWQQEKTQRNVEPKGGRENDMPRPQEKTPRKSDFKRGRGGRDSPSFRPGSRGRGDSSGRAGGQHPASPMGRDCPPLRTSSQPASPAGRDCPPFRAFSQPASPAVGNDHTVGPFDQIEDSDGWNTVSNKSGRQATASPVDNNKYRSKKNKEISFGSFGPVDQTGAWPKGANDAGSRGDSGPTTPTRELDQRTNRFDLLCDSDDNPNLFEKVQHPGNRQTTPTGKGKQGNRRRDNKNNRRGRNQSPGSGKRGRNQAHDPGRSNNNQNNNQNHAPSNMYNRDNQNYGPPNMHNGYSQNHGPSNMHNGGYPNHAPSHMYNGYNQNHAPSNMYDGDNQNYAPSNTYNGDNQNHAPPNMYNGDSSSYCNGQTPSASPKQITEEGMRKITKSIVEEYFSIKDEKEALLCLRELESPTLHHVFVEEAINIVIEKKPEHRKAIGSLLQRMMKDGLVRVNQMCQGLASIIEFAPDFAVDIPHIYKYLGEVLGPIIYDGTLRLNKVKDIIEPLIQANKAGIVMAEALSIAVEIAGKEELVGCLWSTSKITWDMLLSSDEDKDQFIKDKKMEFTLTSDQHSQTPSDAGELPTPSHARQVQEELKRILNNNNKSENNEELINYIEKNVDPIQQKNTSFIGMLTQIVCSSTISRDSSNKCFCDKTLLNQRKGVLLKYISGSNELELQSVYTLQQMMHSMRHPRGLLRDIFQELYEGNVISKDVFLTWENSKKFPDGKRAALSFTRDFMISLHKSDGLFNEEDPAEPPTNVV